MDRLPHFEPAYFIEFPKEEESFRMGIKEVLEWGEELCKCKGEWLYIRKRQCDTCWQEKLKDWHYK